MDLNTDFLLFDILTEQTDPNLRQKQEAELKMLKDRQEKEKENTIDPKVLQSLRKKHDEEIKILKQKQNTETDSIESSEELQQAQQKAQSEPVDQTAEMKMMVMQNVIGQGVGQAMAPIGQGIGHVAGGIGGGIKSVAKDYAAPALKESGKFALKSLSKSGSMLKQAIPAALKAGVKLSG